MRKNLTLYSRALMIVILLFTSTSVKAENLRDSDDYNEISTLEKQIYNEVELFLKEELLLPVDDNLVIEFDHAEKVYVNADISELAEHTSSTDIYQIISETEYVWTIPFNTGNESQYGQVTLAKGLAYNDDKANELNLEEKEKESLKDTAGKWKITAVELYTIPPYYVRLENLKENHPDYSDFIIVGGLKSIHYPMAIGIKNNKADSLFGLGFQYGITDTSPQSDYGTYDYVETLNKAINSTVEDDVSGNGLVSSERKITMGIILLLVIGGMLLFTTNRSRRFKRVLYYER